MSVESSAVVWHHSNADTPTAKLIMLKIADMDGDGGAWPSMKTLAEAGMCTEDAARRIVRKLEKLGDIRTHLNQGGGLRTQKHMRTNVYEVLVTCPWYCDRSRNHRDLRDPKNEALRPVNWASLVEANDPPTEGSPPYRGIGSPPTGGSGEPSLNHPHSEQDHSEHAVVTAGAREVDEDDQPKDDYSDWHPREQIAAAEQYARLIDEKRRRPAPIARQRTPDEQARVDELSGQPCPAQPGFNHWIPPSMRTCVRPGCTATIDEPLEATA